MKQNDVKSRFDGLPVSLGFHCGVVSYITQRKTTATIITFRHRLWSANYQSTNETIQRDTSLSMKYPTQRKTAMTSRLGKMMRERRRRNMPVSFVWFTGGLRDSRKTK